LLCFALTLFVSATLLFLIQPMIGKLLLPLLGGTPAVWNTCMVFFQALLLAGYTYAHATTSWLGTRRQSVLHLGILLLPFLTLELSVDRGWLDYGEGSPIPGLLLVLLISVGLPFFVVSCTAPLLQMWFAGTGHPAARDPYFLYGASNLGSMLALLSYPTVVEPHLTLADQRRLWQVGYSALVGLIVVCAVWLWRFGGGIGNGELEIVDRPKTSPISNPPSAIPWRRRLRWLALAFVPSCLMLGATTYMTTDIAAIPLLWVLPLGLYLLSFILVFSWLPAAVHRLMVTLLPFLVLALVFLMLSEFPLRIWWKILVHLTVLFVAAMVCHGELAHDRPSTRHLTGYYLWMSMGGVLGGFFNALAAPLIFNGLVEYPLALVLACLLMPAVAEDQKPGQPARPGSPLAGTALMGFYFGSGAALLVVALGRTDLNFQALAGGNGLWMVAALAAALALIRLATPEQGADPGARWLDLGLPAALGVLAVGLNLGLRITAVHRGLDRGVGYLHDALPAWMPPRLATLLDPHSIHHLVFFIFIVPVVACAFFIGRPLRFGLAVGALLLANAFCDLLTDDVLLRERSFFGLLHVTDDGDFRRLEHGTTLHGMQRLRWNRPTLAASAACPLAAADPFSAALLASATADFAAHPGREPQTYFHRTGPIGQVFAAYQDALAGQHVGLIGLGSGTLASYGQPGQKLTYYEIDPLVKRIAYNPAWFTFIADALDRKVDVEVVLGDARLKLEVRARAGLSDKFALLVVDAFSSDAIPVHLITREALAIYLDNLADDGLLAFHISNRYLDLDPVLGNLAADAGLVGFIENDSDDSIPGKASSSWVILARAERTLDRLVHEARRTPWRRLRVRPDVGVWTDDYSNLLRVFEWRN
jgi:hypothetical protein